MTTVAERPLPSNLDAERMILGAAMVDEKAFDTLLPLKPEDFFLPQNRLVFGAIKELGDRHEPLEMFTVIEELRAREELERAGGAAYVASLTDSLPKLTNLEHYAKAVQEKAQLRKLIYMAQAIAESAYDAAAETRRYSTTPRGPLSTFDPGSTS